MKFIILILFLGFQLIILGQTKISVSYSIIINEINNTKYDETFKLIDRLCNLQPSDSLFDIFYYLAIKYNNSAEMSEYLAGKLANYIEHNLAKSLAVLENVKNEKLNVLVREFTFGEGTTDKIMDYIFNNYLYHKKYFNYFKKYY